MQDVTQVWLGGDTVGWHPVWRRRPASRDLCARLYGTPERRVDDLAVALGGPPGNGESFPHRSRLHAYVSSRPDGESGETTIQKGADV